MNDDIKHEQRPPSGVSDSPVFLTVPQVAAMLQISGKTVLRLAAADATMPCLRIGRTLRFDRDRLLAWFKMNTQGFGRVRTHKRTHDEGTQRATT